LNVLSFVSGRIRNRENFFSDYNVSKVFENYINSDIPYADILNAHASPPENLMQNVFEKWISHPTFDSYWKDMLPGKEDFENIDIPILSITGYFDADQPGHMYYYDNFQKYASDEVKDKMYFIIGPWDHSGTRRPSTEFGGLNFGENAVIDILNLHKQWFNWTMKDGEKPEFLEDKVSYYAVGSCEWKHVSSLEEMANDDLTFYLSSPNNNPSDIYQSGLLSKEMVNNQKPDEVIYDPLNPRFKTQESWMNGLSDELINPSYLSEDGWLYYHSPVLFESIELSGFITLNLFAEINTKDTDFMYRLYQVNADGTSVKLGDGVMRARFRNSLEKEELVKPGDVNEYKIKSMYLTNRTLEKGSRLRLQIGYLDTPDFQKNYNSGKDVSYETREDAQVATIKIYCSEQYPSSIEFPVLEDK